MLKIRKHILFFFLIFNTNFCIEFKQNPLDPSTPLGYYLPYLVPTKRKVFITFNTYTGNLGGIFGADTKCNTDPNKPNLNYYKAMIVGSQRVACTTSYCISGGIEEHLDWVFVPNTAYYRPDGTYLFTTNRVGIVVSLVNPVSNYLYQFWTGLYGDWRIGQNCSDWTSESSIGSIGNSYTIVQNNSFNCTSPLNLLCVEQ